MNNFTTILCISENANFHSMCWGDLVTQCYEPRQSRAQSPETAKKTAPLIAAHNGLTRSKQEAEKAMFGLLRADLDDAKEQTPNSIAEALREQGIESFVIYSTLSHQPNAPRYRVFVELAEPVSFALWADLQFALAELLGSDPCVNRPAQFMILPTTIKETKEHYQSLIGDGLPLGGDSAFWLNAMEQAAQHQAEADKVARCHGKAAPKPFIETMVGNQVSIIDLVNRSYEWPDLLAYYGYKRKGRNAWTAPESSSGTAGVHILTSSTDGKARIFSHHTSDPAGNRLCDKFDLITIRQFGGNHIKALAEIAKEHFPEYHKHNRREWSIAKRNELIDSAKGITTKPEPTHQKTNPVFLSARQNKSNAVTQAARMLINVDIQNDISDTVSLGRASAAEMDNILTKANTLGAAE